MGPGPIHETCHARGGDFDFDIDFDIDFDFDFDFDFELRASSFELRAASFELRLRASSFALRASSFELRAATSTSTSRWEGARVGLRTNIPANATIAVAVAAACRNDGNNRPQPDKRGGPGPRHESDRPSRREVKVAAVAP
jgi:hypothetical protein